jgi:hypothetical protein
MLHELSPSSLPVWVLNCWPYWPGIFHHLIVFNKHSPFYDLVSEKKLRPPTITKKNTSNFSCQAKLHRISASSPGWPAPRWCHQPHPPWRFMWPLGPWNPLAKPLNISWNLCSSLLFLTADVFAAAHDWAPALQNAWISTVHWRTPHCKRLDLKTLRQTHATEMSATSWERGPTFHYSSQWILYWRAFEGIRICTKYGYFMRKNKLT